MTDKQIIIDGVDVSGCVHFIQDEKDCCDLGGSCKGWANCYYKRLKRKEQECEKLRFPMKDTNYAILTKEEFEKFNQLKAENDLFRTCHDNEQAKRRKFEQCLTEIKEIAEDFYLDGEHVKDKYLAQEILQKISECEGNDVRS